MAVQGAKHRHQHNEQHNDHVDPQTPQCHSDGSRKLSSPEARPLLSRDKLIRFQNGKRRFGVFEADRFAIQFAVLFDNGWRSLGLHWFQKLTTHERDADLLFLLDDFKVPDAFECSERSNDHSLSP